MEPSTNQLGFDDLIGVTLAERYCVKGRLNQGGMGTIYVAHDQVLNREVAIKSVVRNNLDEVELIRFHREGKAASTVRHPNVVQMLDFGVSKSGQPYMVMELIKGLTLAELIQKSGPQSAEFTLRIIEQIANGMVAVHGAGIVHRDLKTSNIMVVDRGYDREVVRILDFGIAKSLSKEGQFSTITQAGQIFGSPHYMSPEQAQGQDLDPRNDIYSLGCIAYEMLTGHVLFDGDSAIEIIRKHITEPSPRLADAPHLIFSEVLEDFVADMVAKDKQDRISSMSELVLRVSEVRHSLIASEHAEPMSDAVEKGKGSWLKENFKAVCLCSMVLLAVIGTGSVLFLQETPVARSHTAAVILTEKKGERGVEESEFSLDVTDEFADMARTHSVNVLHNASVSEKLSNILKENNREPKICLIDCQFMPSDFKTLTLIKPKALNLRGCSGITEEGIKTISQIDSLEYLNLDLVKTTPAAISVIGKMKSLKYLSMQESDLSDEHLKALANHIGIDTLQVNKNPRVTLNGIKYVGLKDRVTNVVVDAPILSLSRAKKNALLKDCHILLQDADGVKMDYFTSFLGDMSAEGLLGPDLGMPQSDEEKKSVKRVRGVLNRHCKW